MQLLKQVRNLNKYIIEKREKQNLTNITSGRKYNKILIIK